MQLIDEFIQELQPLKLLNDLLGSLIWKGNWGQLIQPYTRIVQQVLVQNRSGF